MILEKINNLIYEITIGDLKDIIVGTSRVAKKAIEQTPTLDQVKSAAGFSYNAAKKLLPHFKAVTPSLSTAGKTARVIGNVARAVTPPLGTTGKIAWDATKFAVKGTKFLLGK
jgi:hypothetical protein